MSRVAQQRSHAAAAASTPVRPLSPHEDGAHHEDSIEAAHSAAAAAADDDDAVAGSAHHSEPEDEGEDAAQSREHYRVYQPSATISASPVTSAASPSAPSASALQTPFGKQRPQYPGSSPAEGPEDWSSGMATVPSTPPFRGGTAGANGAGGVVVAPLKLHQAGLAAMKKNLVPGILLQCIALLIILIYYSSDSARASFESLGEFKTDAGYAFSFVSTAIFGGLLPWLIVQLKKEVMKRRAAKAAILAANLQRNNPKPSADLEAGNGHAHAFAVGGANGRDVEPLQLDTPSAAAAALSARAAKSSAVNADGSVTMDGLGTPVALHPAAELAFMMAFWGLKGMEVDAFYRSVGENRGSGRRCERERAITVRGLRFRALISAAACCCVCRSASKAICGAPTPQPR